LIGALILARTIGDKSASINGEKIDLIVEALNLKLTDTFYLGPAHLH